MGVTAYASQSILDATAAGRALLTSSTVGDQRSLLGLGVADSPTFAGQSIVGNLSVTGYVGINQSPSSFYDLIAGGSVRSNTGFIAASNTAFYSFGAGGDILLTRDAAGILAQRNGVNAQAFRLYNTYTDASNYERGKFAWDANSFKIGTEKAGTGLARPLELQTNGETRFYVYASSPWCQLQGNNPKLIISDGDPTNRLSGIELTTAGGNWSIFNNNDLWISYTQSGTLPTDSGSYLFLGRISGHAAIGTSGVERFRISGTGSVGIGTSSPSGKVHIRHTGGDFIRLGIGPANADALDGGISWYSNEDLVSDYFGGLKMKFVGGAAAANRQMQFLVGDLITPKMTINGDGSVAVTSPNHLSTYDCSNSSANGVSERYYRYGGTNGQGSSVIEVAYLGGTVASPSAPVLGRYVHSFAFRTGGTNATLFANPSFAIRHTVSDTVGSSLAPINTAFVVTSTATGTPVAALELLGQNGTVRAPVAMRFGAEGADALLYGDSSNILAQRNTTNAQIFRVYNTYTDTSNYERAKIAWESNILRIGTEKLGTGSARALELQTDGTTRLTIGTAGAATFTSSVSLGQDASAVALWIPSGQAFRMSGSPTSASVFYFDLPRLYFRDMTNGYANTLSIVNSDVGIGTSSPAVRLHVAITAGDVEFLRLASGGQTLSLTYLSSPNSFCFTSSAGRNVNFNNGGSFGVGHAAAPVARLHVKALGNTSSTFAFNVEDSAGVHVFRVRDDGAIHIGPTVGASSGAFISCSDGTDTIGTTANSGLRYRSALTTSNSGADHYFRNYQGNRQFASGVGSMIQVSAPFYPTSGTGVWAGIHIDPTINQTGGASGITRGLWINSNVVAAADFRAIETMNGPWRLTDTYAAGSGSLAGSALVINQTWNTTGTPTAISLNITDTASNASSYLMNLQVGGAYRFRVTKAGTGNFLGNITSAGGVCQLSNFVMIGTSSYQLHMYNATNPTSLFPYNTYTDASNYERGKFAWESNVLRVGTEKLGTGSARALELQTDGTTRLAVSATLPQITIGSDAAAALIFSYTGAAFTNQTNGRGLALFARSGATAGDVGLALTGDTVTATSGANNPHAVFYRLFQPASGTGVFTLVELKAVINQLGGASGVTRGLYVNPALTSAADFRAIESGNGPVIFNDSYSAGSGSLAGASMKLNPTWNTTGAPTAMEISVSDTASTASSNFINAILNGSSKFKVVKDGSLVLATVAVGSGNVLSSAPICFGVNNTSSGFRAATFGNNNTNSSTNGTAIGYYVTVSSGGLLGAGYASRSEAADAVAVGYAAWATADRSYAVGKYLRNSVSDVFELGMWPSGSSAGGRIRVEEGGQVQATIRDSATAPTDGGATLGAEAQNTLMREGYTIQRNGTTVKLYVNDAGTIKEITLGVLA